ncbi:hypothetical protein PPL_12580 [Heterostelium album PN500]|uniref:Uncharacterized protein n=1 Tax=Heterostelium pallidum (strain ATCC 26659 / Pp 5 / PN500) TaxID=670386 RepID=D3BN05_HETP5|nr:hypothetical protein PPL_12580 [Heterostelium album PN500]EFA77367.1 hypothetical protein PPL_12580 [Heterostelium album PN500]|eukprot:XP_020429496.1 hypothetical protein PPL_12580 [Heterostelium album PN500]
MPTISTSPRSEIMHRFYSKLFAAEKDNPELHAEMLKRAWDCSSSRFSEKVVINSTNGCQEGYICFFNGCGHQCMKGI